MTKFTKAIWAHLPQEGPDAVRMLVRRLASAGFDAIIPCLKHPDGYALYQSKIAKVRPTIAFWDPLEVLCDEAGRHGIAVHAWNCVFAEGTYSNLIEHTMELVGRDRYGSALWQQGREIEGWACPAHPATHAYALAIYQELIEDYDIAAVHIDYIRYKDADHCFCDYCRNAFERESGVNPMEIDTDHEQWSDWIDWRVAQITRFTTAIRGQAVNTGKVVSAGVFANYPDCVWKVGQDWEDWARRGLVDIVMPMTYTGSANIARKHTRNHLHILGGSAQLWEGLMLRSATTTPMLIDQIEQVLEAGAQGFVIFDSSGLLGRPLSDDDLTAIASIR